MAFAGRMATAAVAMAMSFIGFDRERSETQYPRSERLYAKARNKPKAARSRFKEPRTRNKHGRPPWGRKLNGVI